MKVVSFVSKYLNINRLKQKFETSKTIGKIPSVYVMQACFTPNILEPRSDRKKKPSTDGIFSW